MNDLDFADSPSTRKTSVQWRRGWRAMRELMANPKDTAKAQDVFMAVGEGDFERNFQRFVQSSAGRRILQQRVSLLDMLADRDALERLPQHSFGRSYLEYMDANGFQTRSLVELGRQTQARWEQEEGWEPRDPTRCWFGERVTLCHDLFHVITGYGTDAVGEAALLGFSQAQLRGKANSLLTFGTTLRMYGELGAPWLRYAYLAWRRGRRTLWLLEFPWEEILPLQVATVRQLAGLPPSGAPPFLEPPHSTSLA